MRKDMVSDRAPAFLIAPAALDADNTPAAVSMAGYSACGVDIHVAAGGITFTGTNKVEFKLTVSNDGSTYAAVTDDDVFIVKEDGTRGAVASGGIVLSLIAAHASAGTTKIGFKKVPAYVKLLADFGGTHAAATGICAIAQRGGAYVGPV